MAVNLALHTCSVVSGATAKSKTSSTPVPADYKPRLSCSALIPQQAPATRRHTLVCSGSVAILALSFGLAPPEARVEDEGDDKEEKDGVIGAMKSLFDPNEKTKSGKILPKAYLKSAREVVKNLRESLKEDSSDITKFRRTADAAKESIKEYLGNWRGKEAVAQEESYAELEKAIRTLAGFYSKAGPSAALPEEVKNQILSDLDAAEIFL